MKWISRLFIVVGIVLLGIFAYTMYDQSQSQSVTIKEAEELLEKARDEESPGEVSANEQTNQGEDFEAEEQINLGEDFEAEDGDVVGILNIPKLDRSIGIVEGTDPESLKNGVGHVKSTVHPNQQEQIVLSGHRDTVFRDFGELEIGDNFIVEMPYGDFEYEIRSHKIVDWDDRSVIGKMGEEALIVSTCYPFSFVGPAPERFVLYAYPI